MCEKGNLRNGEGEEEMFGVALGKFPAEICDKCGESFLDEEAMQKIEHKAKEIGIFGLERKVKIRKSGNSLVVTIPPEIAKDTNMKKETLVSLIPTGKGKIEIEIAG